MDQKPKIFIAKFHEIWGKNKKKGLHLKICADFYEFWGEEKKKPFNSKNVRISTNFGVKPQKKRVLITKSAKKQFLLTNSVVITCILGVLGLELHFSGTRNVTFFGTQSLLGEAQFWFGEHNSHLGGTAPDCPPWCQACCKFTAIYRTVTIAFSLKTYCSKSVLLKK